MSSRPISAPREPSKLRSSFVAEDEDVVLSDQIPAAKVAASTKVVESSTVTTSNPLPKIAATPEARVPIAALPSIPTANSAPVQPTQPKINGAGPMTEKELKAFVAALPETALPIYSFTAQIPSSLFENFAKEREAAKEILDDLLPKFDFSSDTDTKDSGPSRLPAEAPKAFNWAAAGLKLPAALPDGSWKCVDCSCDNPASAKEKCTVCEAPKPGVEEKKSEKQSTASSLPAVKAFDWAAAGVKAPDTTSKDGEWNCAECGLRNMASATVECGICGAAKP